MKNKYFPDEDIDMDMDDLCFVCYMIERVQDKLSRKISMS